MLKAIQVKVTRPTAAARSWPQCCFSSQDLSFKGARGIIFNIPTEAGGEASLKAVTAPACAYQSSGRLLSIFLACHLTDQTRPQCGIRHFRGGSSLSKTTPNSKRLPACCCYIHLADVLVASYCAHIPMMVHLSNWASADPRTSWYSNRSTAEYQHIDPLTRLEPGQQSTMSITGVGQQQTDCVRPCRLQDWFDDGVRHLDLSRRLRSFAPARPR